jgi:hypothetical protein
VAEMRAGMATGGSPGALVANMHGYLAGQAVADWQAVLTAETLTYDLGGNGKSQILQSSGVVKPASHGRVPVGLEPPGP